MKVWRRRRFGEDLLEGAFVGDRELAVGAQDLLLHRARQAERADGRLHDPGRGDELVVELDEAVLHLRQRDVHHLGRGVPEAGFLHVADDADDLARRLGEVGAHALADLDLLADGLALRPVLPRERLVDDDDARRARGVALAEQRGRAAAGSRAPRNRRRTRTSSRRRPWSARPPPAAGRRCRSPGRSRLRAAGRARSPLRSLPARPRAAARLRA